MSSIPTVATPMMSLRFGRSGDLHTHCHEVAFPPAVAHAETLRAMGIWDWEGGSLGFWCTGSAACCGPWDSGDSGMQTSWAVPSADHGFQATGESSYFSLTGSPAQHESPSSLWAGAGAAGFPSSPVPVSVLHASGEALGQRELVECCVCLAGRETIRVCALLPQRVFSHSNPVTAINNIA